MSLGIKANCFQTSSYLIHMTILSAIFIVILLIKAEIQKDSLSQNHRISK